MLRLLNCIRTFHFYHPCCSLCHFYFT